MLHLRFVLLSLLLSLVIAAPAAAQRNPFSDQSEEEAAAKKKADAAKKKAEAAEKKKKESAKKKKAEAEKKKKEAAKKKAEEEAAAAAAEAEEEEEEAEEESVLEEDEQVDDEEEIDEEAEAEQAAAAEAERAAAEEEEQEEEEEEEQAELLRGGRVGLADNFGKPELLTTAVVFPVGLGLAIGGPSLFGEPNASMTSPRLGSIDYRLSVASHGDLREGTAFALGIFDIAGIAYPSLLGGYYLVSGVYLWAANTPLLDSQSINTDHKMIAMAEAVGWTALTVGVVHQLVGRQKPYAAFGREAYGEPSASGTNLSFLSTTSAIGFAMSSFAARDYADWALRNDQGFVTGVILPYAVAYGLSTAIGYSSIYGQQHYFSDVAVSALLGALIGNLTYVAHFDREGNPRSERRATERAFGPTLLTHPDESTTLGMGLSGRF